MSLRTDIPAFRAAKPWPAPAHPLLAGLDAEARAFVAAHLRPLEHRRGARLATAGKPMEVVHFVTDGLVAIVGRAANGQSAETGLVGAGGLVGVSAVLGAPPSALRDAVALTAVRSLALDIAALERIAALHPGFRRELMAHANARIDQATQLCVCAALHTVEQRIARWLLDATALNGPQPLELTHAQLADLLGVRRASVTAGLHLLEGEQALRCRRGRIDIRDADALVRVSCGCQQAFVSRRPPRAHPALSSASSTVSPRD